MIPETIETRTPPNLPPLAKRQEDFFNFLEFLTLTDLNNAYESFAGTRPKAKRKLDIAKEFSALLAFPTIDEFRLWFDPITPLGKRALWKIAFDGFISVSALEAEIGQQLTAAIKETWRARTKFKPELNLKCLSLESKYGQLVAFMPPLYRQAVLPWLVPPPEAEIEGCVFQTPEDTVKPWDNSIDIAESYPLFCEALNTIFQPLLKEERDKLIRSGFKKKDIKELYASSGLLRFEKGNDLAPESADMLARFALCMNAFKLSRPNDGQAAIRKLVKDFFSPSSKHQHLWFYPDSNYLEFCILIDHLNRTPGYYLDAGTSIPASRKVFQDIIIKIAHDGRRFNADKLALSILYSTEDFSFCDKNLEQSLKIRASMLQIGGITLNKDYYDEFAVEGILRDDLLVKPLFKAYCFLFAALGLLEITLNDPPLKRSYRDKKIPISIYDSLESIRVTKFGLWCLDLTKQQPPRPRHSYQAIADKELFLVTVQGNSLERTVFLDKIGEKLGADRWRISPASFIEGCVSKDQIVDRINRFKRLIDSNPSPHWLDLFKQVTERAGLFDANQLEALVFTLPDDRRISQELLEDSDLRKIAMRAEGRLLVVPLKNQKKFFELLARHGIADCSGS
ncbi:MAG: hypothetical protein LBQ88_07675 [Treponema sp.]|jgi:hypothetical protein|nr:hypothetical protein [Treponema sp.]